MSNEAQIILETLRADVELRLKAAEVRNYDTGIIEIIADEVAYNHSPAKWSDVLSDLIDSEIVYCERCDVPMLSEYSRGVSVGDESWTFCEHCVPG